jgi:hypothetical protein
LLLAFEKKGAVLAGGHLTDELFGFLLMRFLMSQINFKSMLQVSTLEELLTNPETGKTALLPVFNRPRFFPEVSFDAFPCLFCNQEVTREERRTMAGFFVTRLFCACGCAVTVS